MSAKSYPAPNYSGIARKVAEPFKVRISPNDAGTVTITRHRRDNSVITVKQPQIFFKLQTTTGTPLEMETLTLAAFYNLIETFQATSRRTSLIPLKSLLFTKRFLKIAKNSCFSAITRNTVVCEKLR